jgi:iron complex outermembrane receptor protein
MSFALAGAALVLPAAAWAQENLPVPAPAPAPAPADAAQPRASDNGAVQDIIVTARRRNESIQSTPVAITAIAPNQLESTATVNISQLQGQAPGVVITTQSTGAATANISIRGIAFADVEKSFDPAVGVNVDGVYIGTSTGQLLDFFDIASIEILRGPQGTLFGRNTIAGVINIRRTRPTGEWGGKFQASIGDYQDAALRGVLNVPVIKDVLAAKLFGFHDETHGYLRNAFTGQHLGRSDNNNFGAAFLLTPTSSFDALLTLEEQKQRFRPYNGSLLRPGDVFCGFVPVGACSGNSTTDQYTIYPGIKPRGYYRARAATLEMNLTEGPIKFTSVTSYRESQELQEQDFGTVGLYDATRRQKYHQFSEEFRASGKIFSNLDYVAGLYYFDSRYRLVQSTNVFGAFAGLQDTIGKSRSEAAFVDLDWEFLPKLRLSGGGRFTHDTKRNINPLIIDPATGDAGVFAKKSWSKFTPKVTLDYRPIDTLMFYATFSRGYRSGGFNGRGQTFFSATTPYDPETVSAYEGGIKSEFFDRKLSINLAGYYTDYKKIQQSSTVTLAGGIGNETIVTNAAGARIHGIEGDLTARPIRNLTLRASAGYTHSHFRGFIVNQPVGTDVRTFDFSAVHLIYAPKITASFNAEYKLPITDRSDVTIAGGYRYLSRYDQQIAADPATPIPAAGIIVVARNDPRLRSDRQNLIDASVSYNFKMGAGDQTAHISVFGRNLLDDRGTATAFTVAAFPTLWAFTAAREPRVIGAQFGFEF